MARIINNTNNFKYSDILDGIINGDLSKDSAIDMLSDINTSYSRNIIVALIEDDMAEAIRLIKESSAFERRLNSVSIEAIELTDEDIIARANNLMLINGLSKEEATLLAFRRAGRLRQRTIDRTTSIESGTFLI